MARQEELFAQTIIDLKRVLHRRDQDSESDDSAGKPTNRGNKLKRKARFVQEGRLDVGNSYRSYRRHIKYNGYERTVISRNPARVDNDGDVIDVDDDHVGSDLEDLTDNAYKDVDILGRLMPLTSAAELKNHPSLSLPYTEKHLDEILRNAQEMVQREQNALWNMKQLAIGLRGDTSWIPVETFETEDDINLILNGNAPINLSSTSSVVFDPETATITSANGIESVTEPIHSDGSIEPHPLALEGHRADNLDIDTTAKVGSRNAPPTVEQMTAMDTENDTPSVPSGILGNQLEAGNEKTAELALENQAKTSPLDAQVKSEVMAQSITEHQSVEEKVVSVDGDQQARISEERAENSSKAHNDGDGKEEDDGGEYENTNPSHRMTTRAKAQAANSPSISRQSSPDSVPFVDPFFQLPSSCLPGRNLGLPHDEADETRRLISAYIQKQEEVVRSSWKLYSGLLKAQRLRETVLEWCTAEGHIGEMSDGEDWYDKEKWGLTDDLEKGKDIEEEEVTATGKKTRNRRNVA